MSRQDLTMFLCLLIIGACFGWSARALTADHQYLMAKTLKYESETSYWLDKLNNEIQETKGDIARERKKDEH